MKNIRLNVAGQPEEMSFDEALIAYKDVKEGYEHTIADITFKYQEYQDFIDDMKEHFTNFVEYDYSRGKNTIFKIHTFDEVKLYVRGNSLDLFVSIASKTEAINADVWKIYNKHSKEDNEVAMYMHSHFMNGGNLDEKVKTIKKEELDYISEKYYPYIDTDIMFKQFFTGNENILLLVGEPGLGKSKMSTLVLKYAFENSENLPYDKLKENPVLEEQYVNVSFVKNVEVLANDKFWRTIELLTPDFVIIDDLDYMLTKRDAEVMNSDDAVKNSFLNQFLSFTDGVEKNQTKFIITTNQKYSDIDTALLRKGRLFDILELRKLDRSEALAIWKDNKLKESEFDEIFHSHEVLPAELGSEISKRLNTRIDNATKSYLKEDGISKVQKAGRVKKIGL